MAVRDDAGGGTGSAGRLRERRLRSFLRHGRMAIAMMLAECTHHSAQRQKKASVTEFFAMPSENSVEDQMLEDGVFQEIMKIDVETPAVLEQVIQEFPEVQFNFSPIRSTTKSRRTSRGSGCGAPSPDENGSTVDGTVEDRA